MLEYLFWGCFLVQVVDVQNSLVPIHSSEVLINSEEPCAEMSKPAHYREDILKLPSVRSHQGFRIVSHRSGSNLYISYSYDNLSLIDHLLTLADSDCFRLASRIFFRESTVLCIQFVSKSESERAFIVLHQCKIINLHKFHEPVQNIPQKTTLLYHMRNIRREYEKPEIFTLNLSVEEATFTDAFQKGGNLSFQFHSTLCGATDSALGLDIDHGDTSSKSPQRTYGEKGSERENREDDDGDDEDGDKWSNGGFVCFQNKMHYDQYLLHATKEPYSPDRSSFDGNVSATVVSYESTIKLSWECREKNSKTESEQATLMLCYGIFNPFYYTTSGKYVPSFPPSCSSASSIFTLSAQGSHLFEFPGASASLPHGYYYFQLVTALRSSSESYEDNVVAISNPLLYLHTPSVIAPLEEIEILEENFEFLSVSPRTPKGYDPMQPGQEISVSWSYHPSKAEPATRAMLHLCLVRSTSYSSEYMEPTEGEKDNCSKSIGSFLPTSMSFSSGQTVASSGPSYYEIEIPIKEVNGNTSFALPTYVPSGSYVLEVRTERPRKLLSGSVNSENRPFFGILREYFFPSKEPQLIGDSTDAVTSGTSRVVEENVGLSFTHYVYSETIHIFNAQIPNQQIFIGQPKVSHNANYREIIEVSLNTGAALHSNHKLSKGFLFLYQDIPSIPVLQSLESKVAPWEKRTALFTKEIDLQNEDNAIFELRSIDINTWINSVSTLSRAFSYPLSSTNSTHSFIDVLRHSSYVTQIREALRILPFPFYLEMQYLCEDDTNTENISWKRCRGAVQSQRFHIADPFGETTFGFEGINVTAQCNENGQLIINEHSVEEFLPVRVHKILSPMCHLTQRGEVSISSGGIAEIDNSSLTPNANFSVAVRYAPSYFYLDTTTSRMQFHVEVEMRIRVPLSIRSNVALSYKKIWNLASERPNNNAEEKTTFVEIGEKKLLGPLNIEIFGILFSLDIRCIPAGSIEMKLPDSCTDLNITPDVSFGIVADYRNFITNQEIAFFENASEEEKCAIRKPQKGLNFQFYFDLHSSIPPKRIGMDMPEEGEQKIYINQVRLLSGKANVTATFAPRFMIDTSLYSCQAQPSARLELTAVGSYPPFPPYKDSLQGVPTLLPKLSSMSSCNVMHSGEYRLSCKLLPFTLVSSHRMDPLTLSYAAMSSAGGSIGRGARQRWDTFSRTTEGAEENEHDIFPQIEVAEDRFAYEFMSSGVDDRTRMVLAGCIPYNKEKVIFELRVKGLLEDIVSVMACCPSCKKYPEGIALSKNLSTMSPKNADWRESMEFRRNLSSMQFTVGDACRALSNIFSAVAESRVEVKLLHHDSEKANSLRSSENRVISRHVGNLESSTFSSQQPRFLGKSKKNIFSENHWLLAVFAWKMDAKRKIGEWLEKRVHLFGQSIRCQNNTYPTLAYYTPPTLDKFEEFLNRNDVIVQPGKTFIEGMEAVDFLSPIAPLLNDVLSPLTNAEKHVTITPQIKDLSAEEVFYLESVFLHPQLELLDVIRSCESHFNHDAHHKRAIVFPLRFSKKEELAEVVMTEASDKRIGVYGFIRNLYNLFEARRIFLVVFFAIIGPLVYWIALLEVPIYVM